MGEIFPPAFVEEFYRVRQSPGIHNLYKFRLGTPTGESRIVNVAIAPLVTRKFHVIGRLIIMDDITERVELESQLSQADKLSSIGLLAAGVAHEVNTPLAVISSYAQMLSKQLHGDPQKSGLMEKITRQTFRASEIVNNLLNFSRTSGTEFGEVDVNKVIHDTLALLEHQFKTTRIQVDNELSDHLPTIHGNAGRLQQVFLNLFLNAKDAMAGGRHAADCQLERRSGQRECVRHRNRHSAGTHSAHLRSVLHHQICAARRTGQRHRAGTVGDLRNYSGACRKNSRGEPPRRRHYFLSRLSDDEENSQCLRPPSSRQA